MGIRHVVMFRFRDEADEAQRAAVAEGLARMPAATGMVDAADYRHGPDLGLNPASWDYVLVAQFPDADRFQAYRDHPAHQELIREVIEPAVAERVSVQHAFP
jgi:hypothetical protein